MTLDLDAIEKKAKRDIAEKKWSGITQYYGNVVLQLIAEVRRLNTERAVREEEAYQAGYSQGHDVGYDRGRDSD